MILYLYCSTVYVLESELQLSCLVIGEIISTEKHKYQGVCFLVEKIQFVLHLNSWLKGRANHISSNC